MHCGVFGHQIQVPVPQVPQKASRYDELLVIHAERRGLFENLPTKDDM